MSGLELGALVVVALVYGGVFLAFIALLVFAWAMARLME